jgi:hypothetical protein
LGAEFSLWLYELDSICKQKCLIADVTDSAYFVHTAFNQTDRTDILSHERPDTCLATHTDPT